MTLISLYTEYLREKNIPFDIIYMDTYGEEEDFPAEHKYVFVNKVNHQLPKPIKALQYFKFRGFAKKILEKINTILSLYGMISPFSCLQIIWPNDGRTNTA